MERINGKALVFSAPSGAGKTTIIKRLLGQFPELAFSVSACSRSLRAGEVEGESYYFLSPEDFAERIARNEFLEWEQVYEGMYYGTLRSELERLWAAGKTVVFDVDVKGAMNIKGELGDSALAIFIAPPSIEVLQQRLVARGTETEEAIQKRVARAEMEMAFAPRFDRTVVNDRLDVAVDEALGLVQRFLCP